MIWSLVLLGGFLGAWELYVALADINEIVLPAPHDVAVALVENPDVLWDNFETTAIEVAGGIALALLVGALLALALHLSDALRTGLYPFLVGSQAVPVPIFAPLLVVWLGFSIAPKLAIIAVVSFFPIVVTTLDALRRVDHEQLKLMRTLDASSLQVLRWVELPAALPAALSGAKIAVAVAVIGAVLAESAGAEKGLGLMITQANAQYDIATSFAAAAVLAALSVTLFFALQTAERRLAPWAHRPRGLPS
jgi:NitT/TauT family transport system permease protein/putative hydroxymethylpyrimidine transport system permease protein